MQTDELDFVLPPDLIAQAPPASRESARLLHYRREDHSAAHRIFSDLPALLRRGDLLVFNDARVLPARFMLRKATGGAIEGLYLSEARPGRWRVLLKGLGRHGAAPLHFDRAPEVSVTVVRSCGEGQYEIDVHAEESAAMLLARVGRMPLPPYIKRGKSEDDRDDLDRSRYQTVFARAPGAVAAPTAALHFSQELLAALEAAGIERAFVTLDVSLATFKPVTADRLEDHVMHEESYTIAPEAADLLNRAKRDDRRIVAVGTTSARVMEAQPANEPFQPGSGRTSIFLRPPYSWKHVNALVTNFHLPRSTLIAMIAALVGIEEQRRLYQIAIAERYRFFSYGDAMLIE